MTTFCIALYESYLSTVFLYHTRKLLYQNLGEEDEGDAPSKEKGPCLYYTQGAESPTPPSSKRSADR
jgi:hypothetical protein